MSNLRKRRGLPGRVGRLRGGNLRYHKISTGRIPRSPDFSGFASQGLDHSEALGLNPIKILPTRHVLAGFQVGCCFLKTGAPTCLPVRLCLSLWLNSICWACVCVCVFAEGFLFEVVAKKTAQGCSKWGGSPILVGNPSWAPQQGKQRPSGISPLATTGALSFCAGRARAARARRYRRLGSEEWL